MPITPQILNLSNLFRAQNLARERREAGVIERYYGEVCRRLQLPITQLTNQIERDRMAGKEPTEAQILRLERIQTIQRQAGEELDKYARVAGDIVAAGQRESIAAGEQQAYQLTLAGFPPGATLATSFTQMPRESVEALVGFLQDGSPLVDVIAKYAGDASQSFGEALVHGLAAGWNPRKLAQELRSKFGMGLTNALRLARTEQLRAYRAATLHSYQESGVVKGWERHAAQDNRTCMACIMLDGKIYSTRDAMDDHPQGRCAMLPITATYAEMGIDAPEPDFTREKGSDWFQRQDEATQRKMMGDAKWEAWKEGRFSLEDLPKQMTSDVWGDSWTPKSLEELVG